MSTDQIHFSLSQLSLHSGAASEVEDWDRSMELQSDSSGLRTPRNTVIFPIESANDGDAARTPVRDGQSRTQAKRTLSELLKLHAEKGTDVNFSPEEASRLAEVLGQWINSGPSPYEAEDDFFSRPHSQDDSSLTTKRPPSSDTSSRPRGQSESVVIISGGIQS
ncbi:hypothetical protein A0H81_02331 [Grifola frondosa]|uniref:Uncharacterized protein n=1 Tax=Grifola frondosa TaxID=5627 RepID=A0A1C7MR21_GRIFR|nr:hypothetical protein A0H81_02331 [Grifola frondosa]